MFFIISKLLVFITTPILWGFTLLLFSVFTKHEKRKKRSFITALIIIFLFSNQFIFDEVMRQWEIPETKYESLKKYDVGIVLGGIMGFHKENNRLQFYRGTDRLLQAVELYRKGYIKKILFTGGSGSVLEPEMKEGPWVKRYLLTIGVQEGDIIIEGESRNTRENALFSKKMMEQQTLYGKYLLVTSGFHQRRATACFKKAGLDVTPYSTDRYAGPRKFYPEYLLIPSAQTLADWNVFIHEIIGYCTYRITGYL